MSDVKYDPDTRSQFLELCAKGWSPARIAQHLQVAKCTLVDWNRRKVCLAPPVVEDAIAEEEQSHHQIALFLPQFCLKKARSSEPLPKNLIFRH